jgi:hypothetical protein
MTGTEPETAPPEPELTVEEYHAQLKELEARFPAPTWDEVKPDRKWLHEALADNTFDPEGKYCGLNVAIYSQRVVGTDTHWLRLRVRLSRELGVHPERIVVVPCFDPFGRVE